MSFKMIFCKKKILAFVLVLSILCSTVLSVYATEDVKDLENSASNLKNELSSLKSDLKQLSKEIDSISSQIEDMNSRIKEAQSELAIAKGKEKVQYEAMKSRIQFMYESGNMGLLESLCSAGSMADFVRRAEYVSTINSYDREALQKLADTRETILEKESQLVEEKQNLNNLLADLDSKEDSLREKIDSTSSNLKTYTAKLEQARKDAKDTENALNQTINPVTPEKPNNNNSGGSYKPPSYTATASDIELFAALIECEAGSSYYEGMFAVASVVMNRIKHPAYPDTLRGVIFARNQFPPATNGLVDKVLKRGVKNSCVQVAEDALGGKPSNVGSCLNFRSASSGRPGTVIGGNVFF